MKKEFDIQSWQKEIEFKPSDAIISLIVGFFVLGMIPIIFLLDLITKK